jgi:hypothetical protein
MTSASSFRDIATRFGVVAQRYCTLVDAAANLDKDQFLLQVYRTLPDLIGEAAGLPDTDPWERNKEDDENNDFPDKTPTARMSVKEWGLLYNFLKEKLGQDDLYWTVFDPASENNEVLRGTLADDIVDIYRDLKEPLLLMDRDAITPDLAIWKWRLLFCSHWGDHAISALRTIHNLLDEKLGDGDWPGPQ